MRPSRTKIEEQLAGEYEGIQVRAVFVASDQPPDESALDGFAGLDQIPFVGAVFVLIGLVVEIWRWVRTGRRARRRSYCAVASYPGWHPTGH